MPTEPLPRLAKVLLALILLSGLIARLYRVDMPLVGYQSWRQADTAAIARNFYEGSMNIFYPQIDWRGNSTGYVQAEFQIFTFLVALLYQMFGVHELLGRVINILVYALSAVLLFQFLQRLFDRRIALIGVLSYSVTPLNYFYTLSLQADALMALCSLIGVYYFWRWSEEPRWKFFAASALGLSMAALIKPYSLYLGLPLLYLCHRTFGWRLFRRQVLWLYAAAVIVPAALWYWHAWRLWETYGNMFGVFGGYVKVGPPPPNDALWLLLGRRLLIRLAFEIATPPGLLFLLIGFFRKPPKGNYLLHWWAVGLLISILLTPYANAGNNYYQLPILFATAGWMAYGTVTLWDKKIFWQPLQRVAVAACCLLIVGSSVWRLRDWMRLAETERQRAVFGQRINRLTDPRAPVIFLGLIHRWNLRHRTAQGEYLGSDPVDFHLSHRKGWSLGEQHATPEFLETLRGRGAKYFATFFPRILERRPELKAALSRSYTALEVTPGWVIYRLDPPSGPQHLPAPSLPGDPTGSNANRNQKQHP